MQNNVTHKIENINGISANVYGLQKTPQDDYTLLLNAFLSEQDVNTNSRKVYRYALQEFFNWIKANQKSIATLESSDIIDYKRHLTEDISTSTGRKRTPLTVNAYITALRIFYGWASKNGYSKDLTFRLKGVQAENGFIKMHLTPAECRKLLETAKNSESKTALRDYTLLKLLLGTGIREIEAIRARVCDIKTVRGRWVLWIQRKGRVAKDKFVPLTGDVFRALNEYLESRGEPGPDEPLFITDGYSTKQQGTPLSPRSVQMITKKYLRQIGLDSHQYSGHSLRHTTAVTIIRGGASLYDAQLALGHSNPATTQRYLKSIENEELLENPPTLLVQRMLEETDQETIN